MNTVQALYRQKQIDEQLRLIAENQRLLREIARTLATIGTLRGWTDLGASGSLFDGPSLAPPSGEGS